MIVIGSIRCVFNSTNSRYMHTIPYFLKRTLTNIFLNFLKSEEKGFREEHQQAPGLKEIVRWVFEKKKSIDSPAGSTTRE